MMSEKCGQCGKAATWVRGITFFGNEHFCTEHAKEQEDFRCTGIEASWRRVDEAERKSEKTRKIREELSKLSDGELLNRSSTMTDIELRATVGILADRVSEQIKKLGAGAPGRLYNCWTCGRRREDCECSVWQR